MVLADTVNVVYDMRGKAGLETPPAEDSDYRSPM